MGKPAAYAAAVPAIRSFGEYTYAPRTWDWSRIGPRHTVPASWSGVGAAAGCTAKLVTLRQPPMALASMG